MVSDTLPSLGKTLAPEHGAVLQAPRRSVLAAINSHEGDEQAEQDRAAGE
jgi:hypothetical protein